MRFKDGELVNYLDGLPSGAPPLLEIVRTNSWEWDIKTGSEYSEVEARDLEGNIYVLKTYERK